MGAAAGVSANRACIYSVVFTVNLFNLLCIELAGRCPPCLLMAGHTGALATRPATCQMHRMPSFLGPSAASFPRRLFAAARAVHLLNVCEGLICNLLHTGS